MQKGSIRFSHSVVSNSLRPHELQHTQSPCPSTTPGVHPNPRPSSRWRHPAISSSVVPFSSCPQSLPASESFTVRQLFAWGGQSTGVSALASFLPKNTQDCSPLEWTGWISLKSKELLPNCCSAIPGALSSFVFSWQRKWLKPADCECQAQQADIATFLCCSALTPAHIPSSNGDGKWSSTVV